MIVFSKSFNTKSISLIHSFTDKIQLTWYSRDFIVQFTTFRLLFIIHFKPFRVPFKVQTKLRKAILFPIIPYCYSRHSVHIRTRCLKEYLNANMQAVTMCVFVRITNNASHDIILSRFQKYHDDYKPKSRFIFSSWKCEPYFTSSGTAMNSIKEYFMGFYFFVVVFFFCYSTKICKCVSAHVFFRNDSKVSQKIFAVTKIMYIIFIYKTYM